MILGVCIAITVVLVIAAVLFVLRGAHGRAVQSVGLAALPMAVYLSGLAQMVIDAARALYQWATNLMFGPMLYTGLGLFGAGVVLWLIGGWMARRAAARRAVAKATGTPAVTGAKGENSTKTPPKTTSAPTAKPAGKPAAKPAGAGDEFDEIEAILRSRGIE